MCVCVCACACVCVVWSERTEVEVQNKAIPSSLRQIHEVCGRGRWCGPILIKYIRLGCPVK